MKNSKEVGPKMKQHEASTRKPGNRLCNGLVALATAAAIAVAGTATATAQETPTGKNILYVPLWLDNTMISIDYWIKKGFGETDSTVTTINPDMSVAAQVNALQDGLASQRYDLIIWFPLDPRAQLSIAKRIQEAGVPQVILQQDFRNPDFSTPRVLVDPSKYAESLANLGAQAVKKYLDQSPKVVWLQGLPDNPVCELQFEGLKRGIKQVDPNAEVVHDQGVQGSTQAEALNVMTDFITRGSTEFNMTMGCGDNIALGIKQALENAGRGKAGPGKVPLTEVQVFANGSPPALQALWREDSSALFSGLLPILDEASALVELGNKLMSGELPIDSDESRAFGSFNVTADCEKWREIDRRQYEGVPGLDIPECSFDYDVEWEVMAAD